MRRVTIEVVVDGRRDLVETLAGLIIEANANGVDNLPSTADGPASNEAGYYTTHIAEIDDQEFEDNSEDDFYAEAEEEKEGWHV